MDCLNKYHFFYFKLDSIAVFLSDNNLTKSYKNLKKNVLILNNITAQRSFLIKNKKNFAAFNIKKNNYLVILSTLRQFKMHNFLNYFNKLILSKNKNFLTFNLLENYKNFFICSLGFKNLKNFDINYNYKNVGIGVEMKLKLINGNKDAAKFLLRYFLCAL